MKKRLFTAILAIITVLAVVCLSACGKEAMTLEKYVKDNPEVQKSIESAMGDSNVLVEVKENEIIYMFDLSSMDQFTEETAKSEAVVQALESGLESAAPTFGKVSKDLEGSTEIQGITTTVNYTWGSEVLVTRTFSSADAE